MSVFPGNIDLHIISTAGDLLISTLTTLKHQGAAFAAHKALQSFCTRCFKEVHGNEIRQLPYAWSERLLKEISHTEIVRDSTLRRSTGYGESLKASYFCISNSQSNYANLRQVSEYFPFCVLSQHQAQNIYFGMYYLLFSDTPSLLAYK